MRSLRALTVALVPLLVVSALAACGGGDDKLSTEEQRYADAFARDLADGDDGLAFDAKGGQCVGDAIVRELGTRPFHEAKVEPADLAGDDTPGQLLGKGRVTDAQAHAIAKAWNGCVDLPAVFAKQAAGQFALDGDGVACFRTELRHSDVLDDYLVVSFTSDDPADTQVVLDKVVRLVQKCSAKEGKGGVLVDAIAASLSEAGDVTPEQATCMAQHVVDSVGADKLVGIGKGESLSAAPPEVQQEFAAAIVGAAQSCGVDLSGLG